jgi:hypothetical protein
MPRNKIEEGNLEEFIGELKKVSIQLAEGPKEKIKGPKEETKGSE